MTDLDISKISNEPMRLLCMKKKKEAESRSNISDDIVSMTFSSSLEDSKQRLLCAIK